MYFSIPAADYLGLTGLTKWILLDPVGSCLSYENMEEVLQQFQNYDVDRIIEKEILSDLKVNWTDFVEDFPSGWKFLFKVWPDFNRTIHITSCDNLSQLMIAANELDEDQLGKMDTLYHIHIEDAVKFEMMEKEPVFFFNYQTKFCSDGEFWWIDGLFSDLEKLQDKDKTIRKKSRFSNVGLISVILGSSILF